MASAADIAKLETKAVAAEKLIELLRQQISQVRSLYPDGIVHLKGKGMFYFILLLLFVD